MKKNFFLFISGFVCLLVGLINSCKKDSQSNNSGSFTEEFDNYNKLIASKGWIYQDNSPSAGGSASWGQGINGPDKAGVWFGFSAYSYKASQDEFVYSSATRVSGSYSLSSWLISPVLSVQNGDKISFYTRADTGLCINRMQVRMDKSISESLGGYMFEGVGDFTTILFDINSAQVVSGYPTTWTKYEYTFTGLSGKTNTRIGFRHYVTDVTNAKGIGIDQFRFQVN